MTGTKKVHITKRVAEKWLRQVVTPEYRLRVFHKNGDNHQQMVGTLMAFRDGRIAVSGVPQISDLGVKNGFDGLDLWSGDREGLISLQAWYEKRGYETSGIW